MGKDRNVACECSRIEKEKRKRNIRKRSDVCCRHCLSKAGKLRHEKNHRITTPTNYKMPLNIENSCHVWENVCKLVAGLKRQADSPNDRPNVDKIYVSNVCQLGVIDLKTFVHLEETYRFKVQLGLTMITCNGHIQQRGANHHMREEY